MKSIFIIGSLTLLTLSCGMEQTKKKEPQKEKKETEACADSCCSSNNGEDVVIACKLTTPELQKRKATVLASLRKQVKSKKELSNGYAFTFSGTDQMLDELNEFIKTERACCDFFTFSLSVAGDQSKIVLEITGPDGAKEFIETELEL